MYIIYITEVQYVDMWHNTVDRGQAGVSNKYTFRLSCDKAKISYLKVHNKLITLL
jgi:hypothetical protein